MRCAMLRWRSVTDFWDVNDLQGTAELQCGALSCDPQQALAALQTAVLALNDRLSACHSVCQEIAVQGTKAGCDGDSCIATAGCTMLRWLSVTDFR